MTMLDGTIAAIATPIGEGGLAVVRISGPQALAVADRCFRPSGPHKPSSATTHTLHHGWILQNGAVVDEVLLAVMKAPRTYTREDVVEISCHGGLLVAKTVLDVLLENGARLALPGEFTRRAFINGRLDLAQAEAVVDLIHSRTERALAAANEQLAGALSRRINPLRDDLMRVLAHVEAHIDFPEEDIAPDTRAQLLGRLGEAMETMDRLIETAPEGRIMRTGIRAVIMGRPNAGKSSLLNQLLGHDRAIVSPVPGTTRDTIEETANIRGIPVVFVDTAGLREAGDAVESEGVRRSHSAMAQAELLLHVVDASQPLTQEDADRLLNPGNARRIVVCNKVDLPRRLDLPASLAGAVAGVSCATGQGMNELKELIHCVVWTGGVQTGMHHVMINSRHEDALKRARAATEQACAELAKESSLEFVAMDLRIAANAIGEIVGKTTTEDLLDSIFNQFCIGK